MENHNKSLQCQLVSILYIFVIYKFRSDFRTETKRLGFFEKQC